MTALLGVVGCDAADDDPLLQRLVARSLNHDQARITAAHPSPRTALLVAAPAWDVDARDRVATDARYTVIAHATICYRHDLARALASASVAPPPPHATDAAWVLAGFQAWGTEAVQRLEGEFAFVVWDSKERSLFAARDHTGGRTLYFARIGKGIAVGTSLRTLSHVPGCPGALNLTAIAEDAANIDLAYARETAYAAVERIPAGFALRWVAGRAPSCERWWDVPIFESEGGPPFEDAADQLRELLMTATAERIDAARGTAVMLSGGYDSTAVYGSGQASLTRSGSEAALQAVSLSHPAGDPGREDETILSVTRSWGRDPRWIDAGAIPAASDDPLGSASRRDEPLSHPYELWNRALAEGCRSAGARVALNGNGGDLWFSVSPLFFADLLRAGQLLQLRREWKEVVGRPDWHYFFKAAVHPNLPPWALSLASAVRGDRPLHDLLYRRIPAWIREDFMRATGLEERRMVRPPQRRGEGHSAAEHAWFLQVAFPERVNAMVFGFCQDAGVELRLPLMDARVARFAARRPRWESNSGRQNKHLLRRSMRGVLPDEVIAPRKSRTGLPTTYFWRAMEAQSRRAMEEFADGMLLAELGIADHKKLLATLTRFVGGGMRDPDEVSALSFAVQAEWWLRSELEVTRPERIGES